MSDGDSAAVQTALAYHEALANRDVETALRHVADDVVGDTPNVHIEGIEPFGAFLGHWLENCKSSALQVACGSQDAAVLIYDLASTFGPVTPIAEWTTIREGKIARIKLIYDRTPYFGTVESYAAFLEKVHAGVARL